MRLGEVGDPHLDQQLVGPLVVEVVVGLAPAADDAVRRGDDDVADPLVARDPLGERGAGEPDPGPQVEHVDGAEHLVEDARPRRSSGGSGRTRPAAGWSCRRRWDRAPPSARRRRRSSRRSRSGATPRDVRSRPRTRGQRPWRSPYPPAPRSWQRRIVARRDRPARHPAPRAAGVGDPRVVGDRLAARPRRHRPGPRRGRRGRPAALSASTASRWPALLGRLRAAGATGCGLALPVEGDPLGLGGPAELTAAALDAGEAVVAPAAGLALVPDVGRGGRDLAGAARPARGSCPTSARPTGRCGARRSRPPRRWPRSTSRGGGPRRPTC